MAFQEVVLTDEEKSALGAKFFKFETIGQVLLGRIIGTKPSTGTYAKPGDLDYVIKTKNEATGAIEEVLYTPSGDVTPKFKKAGVKVGFRVRIEYTSDLDVGKEKPMRVFKVAVDPTPPPAGAAPVAPPPPPKPAPKPAAEDDIDF